MKRSEPSSRTQFINLGDRGTTGCNSRCDDTREGMLDV